MKLTSALVCALLLSVLPSASAHQLDEYIQATTISLERGQVRAKMRLTPGVEVFSKVMAVIDANRDGVISKAEEKSYAERVRRDLSLTLNGRRLELRLVSYEYGKVAEMKAGRGEIHLEFAAVPRRGGHNRTLIFENHHQRRIAAYLVNCLVPSDPDIQVTRQKRNYQQSRYQLEFVLRDKDNRRVHRQTSLTSTRK